MNLYIAIGIALWILLSLPISILVGMAIDLGAGDE